MKWSEVRKLSPNQYVFVEDLKSRMEDGKLCVEAVSIDPPFARLGRHPKGSKRVKGQAVHLSHVERKHHHGCSDETNGPGYEAMMLKTINGILISADA